MRPARAVLIMVFSAALTYGVAALLMSIADRKQEGRLLDACPCPSESCPHPGRGVE